MANIDGDYFSELLKDGWQIEGHSVAMFAAGALTHNILLRKDYSVKCLTIIINGNKEVGRYCSDFAPNPPPSPKKKGIWG